VKSRGTGTALPETINDTPVNSHDRGERNARPEETPGEPRSVLFVGNFLTKVSGSNMPSQEIAAALRERGWTVFLTSGRLARLPRLVDMLATAWFSRHRYQCALVDIFSGDAFFWAEATCWVFRRAGKPYGLTLHGGNLPAFARRWPGRVRRLLESAEFVTSPSGYLQEGLRQFSARCQLVPNCVDLSRYRYRERTSARPRLVWLRAFHAIYNPMLAPRVVALLVKEFPDVHLVMAGRDKMDGSREETIALARALGVADHIEFPGGMPKEEVPALLDRGDIFLNTTDVDNTPVSVLEAMACGLCVVSTNVGGIPYMLKDGEDALLAPPNDPAPLAAAIRRILKSGELAGRLSRNGRANALQHDWSSTLPVWERLFDGLRTRQTPGEPDTHPVLFVGNFFSSLTGANSLSEEVANRLEADGWRVYMTSHVTRRLPKLADMVYTAWRLRRRYAFGHVDVFSGDAFFWAEATCWVMRRVRKPYVLTMRGGNLPQFARRWPNRVRRLLASAVVVTAPSSYLKEAMTPYCASSMLLPNSLDLQLYHYRVRVPDRPRIIWLRAFHKIYNPTLAPRILAALVRDFPDATLSMVGRDKGDGSYQATRELAESLGVAGRMEFPGGVLKAEVPHWLDRYDIFLNTTNIDNTPVSVLEAMACGLCVVSTNVGGIPYLVNDGEEALLSAPDDAAGMTRSIARLMREEGLAARLSRSARSKVEQFDWSRTIPQWKTLFDSLRDGEAPGDGTQEKRPR